MTGKSQNIGSKIKALRLAKKMTQEQLAEKLGVTYQQVQKYESGQSQLTTSRLEDLATVLETNITQFFNRSEDSMVFTKEEMSVVEALRSIKDEEIKETLVKLVKLSAARR